MDAYKRYKGITMTRETYHEVRYLSTHGVEEDANCYSLIGWKYVAILGVSTAVPYEAFMR